MTDTMLNSESHYNPINLERHMLCFLGLYYGNEQEKWRFYKIHFRVWMTCLLVLWLSMTINLFVVINNLEILFELLKILIICTNSIIKIILFRRHLPLLYILDKQMHQPIFNQQNEKQNGFFLRIMMKCKIFVRCYQLVVIITFLSYNVLCIVKNRGLQIPIWTPMEQEEYRVYLIAFICYAFFAPASVNPIIEGVMSFLISFMTGQIEILNDNLEWIVKRNSNDSFTKQEIEIQRRLKKCIIHHTKIIEFVANMEIVFSSQLFVQVATSIGSICVCFVEVTMVPRGGTKFVSTLCVLFCLLAQITTFCYVGQAIASKSSNIIQACYMSNWYTCSSSTKKIFFILMECSKKEITFSAGKLFTLSFVTLVTIIRNAYSYCTVIMRITKENT